MRRVILSAVALAIGALSMADAQIVFSNLSVHYGIGNNWDTLGLATYGHAFPDGLDGNLPAGTTVTSDCILVNTWATVNPFFPLIPGTTTMVSSHWYNPTSCNIFVNTDQTCLHVTLYSIDGDTTARRQLITRGSDVINIDQPMNRGVYTTFQQGPGNQTYSMTRTAGSNAINVGVALDLCATHAPTTTTTTTAPTTTTTTTTTNAASSCAVNAHVSVLAATLLPLIFLAFE